MYQLRYLRKGLSVGGHGQRIDCQQRLPGLNGSLRILQIVEQYNTLVETRDLMIRIGGNGLLVVSLGFGKPPQSTQAVA